MALGATEEVTFKDPSKPTFISLMEGLLAARQAMEGVISNESIVQLFNEYLQKHGHEEELQPASDEERGLMNGTQYENQGNNRETAED